MMVKSLWQRFWIVLGAVAVLATLVGCSSAAGTAAVAIPAKPAADSGAFKETEKADDLSVTLAIAPLKIGDNHVAVTLDKKDVTAVEAQIIMAAMGHGQIVDLKQSAPGKFEIDTNAIDMEGRWMIRVESTLANGETKTATFYTPVK